MSPILGHGGMFIGTPTLLSAVVIADSAVKLTFTPSPGAVTLIFRNGASVAAVPPGTVEFSDFGLTPAQNYTYMLQGSMGGIQGQFSNSITVRPVMQATGGTVVEPGDGHRYHYVLGNDTLNYLIPGRVDYLGVGRGGDGATGTDQTGGGGGSASYLFQEVNNLEPAGIYPVTVGTRGNSGVTVYRDRIANPGRNGEAGLTNRGGNGADNDVYSGGQGFNGGEGNSAGGGGGAGYQGGGASTNSGQGGQGGGGIVWPYLGTVGQGGAGGRGTGGHGENAASYGGGGNGAENDLQAGGLGRDGIFIIRYPI